MSLPWRAPADELVRQYGLRAAIAIAWMDCGVIRTFCLADEPPDVRLSAGLGEMVTMGWRVDDAVYDQEPHGSVVFSPEDQ